MLQYFAWVTIRALNWRACACLGTGKLREKAAWFTTKTSIPKLIIRIIVFTAAVAHSRIREFLSISSNTFHLLLSTVSRGEEVFNRTKQQEYRSIRISEAERSFSSFSVVFPVVRRSVVSSSFQVSAVSKRLRPPFRRKRIESTVQIERRRYAEGGREIDRIENHSREAGKEEERKRMCRLTSQMWTVRISNWLLTRRFREGFFCLLS